MFSKSSIRWALNLKHTLKNYIEIGEKMEIIF